MESANNIYFWTPIVSTKATGYAGTARNYADWLFDFGQEVYYLDVDYNVRLEKKAIPQSYREIAKKVALI